MCFLETLEALNLKSPVEEIFLHASAAPSPFNQPFAMNIIDGKLNNETPMSVSTVGVCFIAVSSVSEK